MEEMKIACQVVLGIMFTICLIAVCFGNIPEVPAMLVIWSALGCFIFDFIESIQEDREKKRKKKALKRELLYSSEQAL